jgi:hypothetical protein
MIINVNKKIYKNIMFINVFIKLTKSCGYVLKKTKYLVDLFIIKCTN